MEENTISNIKSVLFLGIGGVSMHQLALSFKDLGIKVYGYDVNTNAYTKKCEENGIKVIKKFNRDFLHVDLCVKTGAIGKNKYITELTKLGVKILDRAEVLGFLCSKFKHVIAVAGTHGKSTTATLIYEILREANFKVSSHIGADVFGARFNINDDFLVVEACEYNKSFLSLYPTTSLVTNVEADHIDSYGNLFNLKNAFSVFLRRGKFRYIYNEKSTNYLRKIKDAKIVENTELNINPKLKGEHNLKNIALAVAVCKDLGVKEKTIISVVNRFKGVPRRFEYLGLRQKQKIYIDYAHHPTEVNAFVQTFKEENKNSLIVFQPHTYSRTKLLLKDFVSTLSKIENLIIFKEYPAREKRWQGMSAYELYEILKVTNTKVKYCSTLRGVCKNLANFDAIAFVGAGNIDQIAKKIIKTY